MGSTQIYRRLTPGDLERHPGYRRVAASTYSAGLGLALLAVAYDPHPEVGQRHPERDHRPRGAGGRAPPRAPPPPPPSPPAPAPPPPPAPPAPPPEVGQRHPERDDCHGGEE